VTTKKQFRGTDLLICSLFPVGVVLFVLFAGLVHGPWVRFAEVGLFVISGLLLALPLWVVLHIIFNNGRTTMWLLWLESSLAGVWLAIGSYLLLIKFVGGLISSLMACLIGLALALTPYTVRFLRSPSGRGPATE
jgi:hypothetical protein